MCDVCTICIHVLCTWHCTYNVGHAPHRPQAHLLTHDEMPAGLFLNYDEVTTNNAESINNATTAQLRMQPIAEMARQLLHKEMTWHEEQATEAQLWLGGGVLVLPYADQKFGEQLRLANSYNVDGRYVPAALQ